MAEPADDLIGPPDTAMLSQPDAAMRQTERFAKQRQHSILNAAVDITGDEDYEALAPGTRFMGPDRKQRIKPYEVKSDEDFDLIPEGATFIDPEGKTRKKPVAEGVGYSADTLYQMARTPETRRQALEKFYGDKVKQDTRGEFYIEDEDGRILRPGHGVSGFAGSMTAEAAPAAGMLLGGAIGGAADVETGVVPGAAAGAMLGAAAGRQLNNVALALAGIHETLPSQIKSMAGEAAGVGAGELVGRGLATIPAALAKTARQAGGVRSSAANLRENLPQVLEQFGVTPERARKFLGTTQDAAERASNITREEVHIPGQPEGETTNVRVPPSVYAPEAPYLKKIEEFDRVFRSQDVVQQSWEALYNKQAEEILADKQIGVHMEELATRATKKISSQQAGQLALSAAQKDMAAADAALENARRDAIAAARRPIDQVGGEKAVGELRQQAMQRLTAAYERAQASAENTIQTAAKNLRNDIEMSIKAAAEGEDTSDLNRVIASSFQAYNIGLRQRARMMYDAANDAAGGSRLDIGSLSEEADGFLKSVPEQVRQKYPVEIANLAKIAKALEREGQNEPIDTTLSFGELHQLRSWFRHGIDYQDMTPDMRQGSLKLFEKKINDLLRSGIREDVAVLPEGLTVKSGPQQLSMMDYRAPKGRRVAIVNAEGQPVFEAALEPSGDGYQVARIANVSARVGEPIKNLGEAGYIEAAKVAAREGKKLYAGQSGETSEAARKVQQRLVQKGYARDIGDGVIEVFPERASDPLETAAKLLDKADEFYRKNIPFLSDHMVQGTIDMLKSGEGANPEALAKMFFDPERTSAMRRVRGIVGENLWKGVQAADVRHMLDNSKILGSTDIDGAKFAAQVEDRIKKGILETAYDAKTAARLQKIATDVRTLKGELPITSDPGDTISTLMNRAALAKAEADKFAEMDPLKALNQEMSRVEKEYNQATKLAKLSRKQEPLHFLYENSMSHLAVRAADKILGNQDLIMAAATKFGRESPEFNALRQVYAARFLQREFPKTAAMRAQLGHEMTEEVQALMFPGVTRDQMVTLAKNMEFLFSAGGTDVGGAMAAASRVLHPEANLPISSPTLRVLLKLPVVSSGARFVLGKFYALAMDATTHPNFINWLAGRLQGDAFARAEARAAIQQRIKMGALLGRGFGQQVLAPQQTNEQPKAVQ